MATQPLPENVSQRIAELLREMEETEGEQLRAQGPVILESVDPLWYVVYKTQPQ